MRSWSYSRATANANLSISDVKRGSTLGAPGSEYTLIANPHERANVDIGYGDEARFDLGRKKARDPLRDRQRPYPQGGGRLWRRRGERLNEVASARRSIAP